MTYLLDVNVLIALIDPDHVQHGAAHQWFLEEGQVSWATCPITENGLLRIVGHAKYPNSPGSPAALASTLSELRSLAGHEFWPDAISLLDTELFDMSHMLTTGQITDSYLLALARFNGGKLATFDRRFVLDAVVSGAESLHLIA